MSDDLDIAITFEGEEHPILCGLCHQKVRLNGELDTDSAMIGCASCDNWASQKEVVKIATDYVVSEMQLALNRMMKETARKSKVLSFKGQTKQNKRYRFIA